MARSAADLLADRSRVPPHLLRRPLADPAWHAGSYVAAVASVAIVYVMVTRATEPRK